jgi:hypothetical protein
MLFHRRPNRHRYAVTHSVARNQQLLRQSESVAARSHTAQAGPVSQVKGNAECHRDVRVIFFNALPLHIDLAAGNAVQ